ncbi:MAG: phosphotransferase family protein [Rhodospirillaceae bacterium]|nr:MAG: phosphotransferase family protein [Rhodospirillaceae bacterium]
MALVNLRDPETVRQAILPWLHEHIAGADEIVLPTPRQPDAGGSSDTFFLIPMIRERGVERREDWVLRIEATDFQIYKDPSVERQFRVMEILAQSGEVPVPKAFWYEPDRQVLGAPFFLMERAEGKIPDSFYHSQGLFTEVPPTARATMWLSGIEAMAKIHRADLKPFQFLARPALGPTGLDQEIAVWDEYMRWSGAPILPIQERVRQWLSDHAPLERPTGLAWGDARPVNMVFRNNACRAVIDWETVSLGGAETDLGWWVFFDWFVSDGIGVPRLEGLGGRDETIKVWEHFAGRKAQAMEWHEVFATWRYSLISDRARYLVRKMNKADVIPDESENPVPKRLAALIGS